MTPKRTLSLLALVGASVLSFHCGSSTSDATSTDGGSDAMLESGSECSQPLHDCLDECTGGSYGPSCVNGFWTCDPWVGCEEDAGADAADDADSGCSPVGAAVPVSCEPFPENTTCNPFGVWSLVYATEYPGKCLQPAIDSVSIEKGSDGIVRVSFGFTAAATLTPDGCELQVVSSKAWTNPSENGIVTHTLTLKFDGDGGATASGDLEYSENGFCSGSGTTTATATKLTN